MSDELYWLTLTVILTAFQAVPYILERIGRIGLLAAMGYSSESGHGDSQQPTESTAIWAKRVYRAHMNSVETLPVFAALVLISEVSNKGGELVACAAMVYFFSRIAHYVVYAFGIPVLRTLSFAISLGSILTIAYAILAAG